LDLAKGPQDQILLTPMRKNIPKKKWIMSIDFHGKQLPVNYE